MTPTAAMIFTAGFGTRMGELTRELPKPMVPVGDRPMIAHAIDLLRDAGIEKIVANTHYLPDRIEPYLRDQGVEVHRETPDILDTGGGLRAAGTLLGKGPVITINPDALWLGANPVHQLLEAWRPGMQALLALVPKERARGISGSGDFSLESGRIRRKGPHFYGGAQIIETALLDRIDASVFSLNAYWDMLATLGDLHGLAYRGAWFDIGNPAGLAAANERLRNV